ncbi:MAG: binding domain, partial [Thermoplasmatales archaeon]|nr:binding domain [Thermoplasmatales archaeon]
EMVLRKDFDQQLLSLAQQAGATFQAGKSVIDVIVQKEKVSVMLEDGQTLETQMVIGCDGMHSVVAEKTNLAKKLEVLCVSLVQEQPMTPKQLTTFFTKKTPHIPLHKSPWDRRVRLGVSQEKYHQHWDW